MISNTYAQELFAVGVKSESTRPSERTSTKSLVAYLHWESTPLQTTRNPQKRSLKRACLCRSIAAQEEEEDSSDEDQSSDYSSANESFLDEDPSSTNDPDVLGPPGCTSRALGSLVPRFERAPLWLEVSPSARVLLVAFPRLLAIAWRHGANLARSLSKNSGRVCADGLQVIGEVFFFLYPVRRSFQGKM